MQEKTLLLPWAHSKGQTEAHVPLGAGFATLAICYPRIFWCIFNMKIALFWLQYSYLCFQPRHAYIYTKLCL